MTEQMGEEEFERLVKFSESTWVAPITAEARRARAREQKLEKALREIAEGDGCELYCDGCRAKAAAALEATK